MPRGKDMNGMKSEKVGSLQIILLCDCHGSRVDNHAIISRINAIHLTPMQPKMEILDWEKRAKIMIYR